MQGEDCAMFLGCPGMVVGIVLAQPLSVCASLASMLSRRLHGLVGQGYCAGIPVASLSIPQAFLVYSHLLLCRGPLCLSHVRLELCHSPPSFFTIREGGEKSSHAVKNKNK